MVLSTMLYTSMKAATLCGGMRTIYGTLLIPFGVPGVEKLNIVSVHITNVRIVCELQVHLISKQTVS